MPTATARFSVNDLLDTTDPQGYLTEIITRGLFDGKETAAPIDIRYSRPTIPIAQYRTEEDGIGAVDGDLPTLYDAGVDPDRILKQVADGSYETENYEWGEMKISIENTGNNRLKITLDL